MTGFDGIQGIQGPGVPVGGIDRLKDRLAKEAGSAAESAGGGSRGDSVDFKDLMKEGIESVSDLQNDVRTKMEGLVTGETKEVHEVLLAMGKAEVAFQLMLEIRNRLVDSWKEITRIHV